MNLKQTTKFYGYTLYFCYDFFFDLSHSIYHLHPIQGVITLEYFWICTQKLWDTADISFDTCIDICTEPSAYPSCFTRNWGGLYRRGDSDPWGNRCWGGKRGGEGIVFTHQIHTERKVRQMGVNTKSICFNE